MKWWQLKKRDADLERELRSDLELEEEEQRDSGASPEEARYAARRAFGNATLIKQQTREAWGWVPLERFVQDLRYAWRQLQKSPGFTLTALCTLALGIGASVAIFGFVDAALLQPLPYANPARIMSVNESSIESPRWPLSYPDFLDWRQLNKSFSSLDIYGGSRLLAAHRFRHGAGSGRAGEQQLFYDPRCASHAGSRFQSRRESDQAAPMS